jgi:hypothetical protein
MIYFFLSICLITDAVLAELKRYISSIAVKPRVCIIQRKTFVLDISSQARTVIEPGCQLWIKVLTTFASGCNAVKAKILKLIFISKSESERKKRKPKFI